MEYSRITASQINALWELQKAYKAEIEEEVPTEQDLHRLKEAMEENQILFYGAWDGMSLTGCCSVIIGFSTFNYAASGVFEDFYIRPEYRHKGIARELVKYAWKGSGVESLTVGCADCDVEMYQSLGFQCCCSRNKLQNPTGRTSLTGWGDQAVNWVSALQEKLVPPHAINCWQAMVCEGRVL